MKRRVWKLRKPRTLGRTLFMLFIGFAMVATGTLTHPKPLVAAPCTASGHDVTIASGCEFAAGTYFYTGTLTINAGVTVTMQGNTTSGIGVTLVSDNITVNGTISADSQGYPAGIVTSGQRNGQGPGGGITSAFASGGAHAGRGGGNNTNLPYGSAFAPITLGSGGANDGESGSAGAGGGAVHLFIIGGGAITLGNGAILTANGGNAATNDHGGGAGGSIWLEAPNGSITISSTHTATIRANGGNAVSNQGGGSGGGGRLASHYTTFENSGNVTMQAAAGTPGTQSGFLTPGGAGSIFLKDTAASNGDLIFDNLNRVNSNITDQVASSTYQVDNLTIRNGARFDIPDTFTTALNSGGSLTGGGTQQSRMVINAGAIFDSSSSTFFVNDIDIDQTGDFDGTDNLVVQAAAYTFDTTSARFTNNTHNRIVDLTLYTGTTFSTRHADPLWVDNLLIQSGGTMTHEDNSSDETHKVIVSATSTINVNSGGTINVDSKGYDSDLGPGGGTNNSSNCCGSGGGHGGNGGNAGDGPGGSANGSVSQPSGLGSGGGAESESVGGSGGGAVKLTANGGSGSITIDGTITASAGGTPPTQDAGGGAGGSVWIDADTVAGSGTISVIGGNAPQSGAGAELGGGGGGGRIAIHYDTNSSSLTLNAYGGAMGPDNANSNGDGGAGTIYVKDNAESFATLTVSNNNRTSSAFTNQVGATETYKDVTIASGADYEIGLGETLTLDTGGSLIGGGTVQATLTINSGGTFDPNREDFTFDDIDILHEGAIASVRYLVYNNGFYLFDTMTATFTGNPWNALSTLVVSATTSAGTFSTKKLGTFYIDALTLKSGSTMTHEDNSTDETHKLTVSATSTIDIQSGATINVDEKGYDSDLGPGGGTNNSTNCCGSGGGHGGNGGTAFDGLGGVANGSVSQPSGLGSAGGAESESLGGSGGGAVKLIANGGSGSITISGTITASGGTKTQDSGGGAGGSVWIDADTVAGSGTISVIGGNAPPTGNGDELGGGGGGGRIAIYFDTDNSNLTLNAYGGAKKDLSNSDADGGAGTIYVKDNAEANAVLTVSNNNRTASAFTNQVGATETYKDVTIANGAKYEIGSSETFTLATGGAFTGGGAVQPSMYIQGGGVFDSSSSTFLINDIDVDQTGDFAGTDNLVVQAASYIFDTTSARFTNNTHNRIVDLTLYTGATFSSRYADTLWVDNLLIQSGATMTHEDNSTVETHMLTVSATSTIDVRSGGLIDVDGKGFLGGTTTGSGPGGGAAVPSSGSGGSYGGNGGRSNSSASTGATYGSPDDSFELGSSGGGGSLGDIGGDGAGAIKLTAPSVTINGTVSADGVAGSVDGGGGSGGAVWIDADTSFTGSGTITANGGAGLASRFGGGGGGGRIIISHGGSLPSMTRQAFGGARGTGSGGVMTNGGAGTIFIESSVTTDRDLYVTNNFTTFLGDTTQSTVASQTYDNVTISSGAQYVIPNLSTLTAETTLAGGGTVDGNITVDSGGTLNPTSSSTQTWTDLGITLNGSITTVTTLTYIGGTFINNGTFSAGLTTLTLGAGSNWRQQNTAQLFSGSTLTIQNGGTFTQEHTSTINITTVTIESGGTLTHCDNTTTHACEVDISATTFDLQLGGTVTANAVGYDGSEGPGAGTDGTQGGGGGYGGAGGAGLGAQAGGGTYGDANDPTDLGSGGGEDTDCSPVGDAGAGAGTIILAVSGTITVDGNILADGETSHASCGGGGGSGGSVKIDVSNGTWAGSGCISADGGNGSNGGGGGGGGRIYVAYQTKTYSGCTLAATGGSALGSGTDGSDGTALEVQNAPTIDSVTHSPATPEVGDNVYLACQASKAVGGISKIEIFLDGTAAGNLKQTCNFSPAQTTANCDVFVGSLSAGAHTTTCRATDNNLSTADDTDGFTVVDPTTLNSVNLDSTKVSVSTGGFITMTFSATSSGTLTVVWPSDFVVTASAVGASSDACFTAFDFSASALRATKTDCVGTVQLGGFTVTNPSTAGPYLVTWEDGSGSALVTIVDDDLFNITASVDPVITFNVGAQAAATACDGTFSGDGGTVGLGLLDVGFVTSSDASSVPHICVRFSTNAPGGAVVTVLSTNASLESISTPADSIPSSTATLVAGDAGYGLCVGSEGADTGTDTTTPSSAAVSRVSPFDTTCTAGAHGVGGVTMLAQTLISTAGPTQNAFARVYVKAAISSAIIPHDDYSDTLTFILTATY